MIKVLEECNFPKPILYKVYRSEKHCQDRSEFCFGVLLKMQLLCAEESFLVHWFPLPSVHRAACSLRAGSPQTRGSPWAAWLLSNCIFRHPKRAPGDLTQGPGVLKSVFSTVSRFGLPAPRRLLQEEPAPPPRVSARESF